MSGGLIALTYDEAVSPTWWGHVTNTSRPESFSWEDIQLLDRIEEWKRRHQVGVDGD